MAAAPRVPSGVFQFTVPSFQAAPTGWAWIVRPPAYPPAYRRSVRRLQDTAGRHRRRREADERAGVLAGLRDHLQHRVAAVVARRALRLDPRVRVRAHRLHRAAVRRHDRPRPRGGRRVGVAGAVDRADLERVRSALSQARVRPRAGAVRELRVAVEAALVPEVGCGESRLSLPAEPERRRGERARVRRLLGDGGLRRRAVGDRPAVAVRRRVDVAGRVDRPDLEGVRPLGQAAYVAGDSHSANAAASSAHSNVESISFALKVNVALVAVVEASGFSRIIVFGGTATVHVYSTGVSSTRPSGRSARRPRTCARRRRGRCRSSATSRAMKPRPSSAQKNSTSVWSDENLNVALVESLGSAGKAASVVSGGPAIVHS